MNNRDIESTATENIIDSYKYGWHDEDSAGLEAKRGLSEDVIRTISKLKDEPKWMLQKRLHALKVFNRKSMPNWGANLNKIDFNNIKYFVRSAEKQAQSWEDLPQDIKLTYDKLGIPDAEKKRLVAGVAAQYECLRGDMRVWTVDRGSVPIKSINTHDKVIVYDSKLMRFSISEVIDIAAPKKKLAWKLETTHRVIYASDNHPFLIADSHDNQEYYWRQLSKLEPGMHIVAPDIDSLFFGTSYKFIDNDSAFPKITDSDLLWWVGVLLGSVNIYNNNSIELNKSDIKYIDRFIEIALNKFNINTIDNADNDKVYIENTQFIKWLINSNILLDIEEYKNKDYVPPFIYKLTYNERKAFVDGYTSSVSVFGESIKSLCDVVGYYTVITENDQYKLLNYDLLDKYEEIISIKLLDETLVNLYDITIDSVHNFVAEGLVVHNSEVVYHKIRDDLEKKGVVFVDTDTGLKKYPEVFKKYFGSVIPTGDNKFSALNTSVWSGGSFIIIPEGVHVDIPLQAYFRINTENMGQFERTLIIANKGSYVHYVEGCTAPIYSSDSLHSAVVEIIVHEEARVRYTTIQNWSNNVYNLVTKRAIVHKAGVMEWIDGNIGSKVTMKYPSVYLVGEYARGETLSLAFAGSNQHQDSGAKMIHVAPNTSSQIVSKSIARNGGRTSYRGLIEVQESAKNVKSAVKCDALLIDNESRSDTYPYNNINSNDASIGHEATVSKIGDDQLFYCMSRGMSEDEAMAMIVRGFIEPISKELPMEYAIELNRLIALQMEGAIG